MGSLLITTDLNTHINYFFIMPMEGLTATLRREAKRDIPYKSEIIQSATLVCWILQLTSGAGNELTFFFNFLMTVLIHCRNYVFGESCDNDEVDFVITSFSFVACMKLSLMAGITGAAASTAVLALNWIVFAALVQDQVNAWLQ